MKTRFRVPVAFLRLALLAMLASFSLSAAAQSPSDYTQSAASISATQVKISFRPTIPAALVDVHYNVPGLPTQSFRMTNAAGTWERTIDNLSAGTMVAYSFTYEKSGPLYVTPQFTFTHSGTGGNTVATPTFTPPGGSYTSTQSVTIRTTTAGATIRYTTTGATPTASSPIYTAPLSVPTSRTLKAIALKSGMTTSAVAAAVYTIGPSTGTVAAPAFSPPGGGYANPVSVSLASATAGATIHYTANGATPTTSAPIYTGPIGIGAGTTTLKAFAVKAGMTSSAVVTHVYTISTQTGDGRFPITFVNNTRGIWRSDQIFVYALGMNAAGQWCYMRPDGTMLPMNPADENAPNHLTKNGRNYANYSFPISQASNFRSPTYVRGGRLYISIGSPMYIPLGNNAWGGPDLLNPADPNNDVYYDWYEYTYVHNEVPFGGNTTQVDQFGFPMTARLVQTAIGYDVTKGVVGNRDTLMSRYASTVSPAFRGLASQFRIKAPYKADFRPGQPQANYLQPYIDQVWNFYAGTQFRLQRLGDLFVGQVVGGRLQFTKNGVGPFFINKPATFDVFACAGSFALGSDTEKELEAELCAAFNRGVAMNTANWASPTTYYANALRNEYSQFWHSNSPNGKAYGFAYDDVNDQSSVKILPNSNPPTSLTISIGW